MKDDKDQDEAKRNNALMQALIRIAAIEKALITKGVITEEELAKELASVISDVADTVKSVLSVNLDEDQSN